MTFPFGNGVKLLAEHPSGLLALYKPDGILSHPNAPKDRGRALLKAPYDSEGQFYEVEKSGGESVKIWLLNRLDSATSGVLLVAKDQAVADEVKRQFAEDRVRKKYVALVFGAMKPSRQVWRDRLQVTREKGKLRTSAGGGAPAETEAKLLKSFPGRFPISLLELYPKTGRTHQLRVQCAKRGLPIVGDQTYGDFFRNREFVKATKRKRLFLHSAEVELILDVEGQRIRFSARASIPKAFTP